MSTSEDASIPAEDAALSSLAPSLVARSDDIVGDGNFPQGCTFSPDGLCALTSTASDHRLRLYNTPLELLEKDTIDGETGNSQTTACSTEHLSKVALKESAAPWRTALNVNGGDTVRSYAWYPSMDSSNPSTCCFLSSSREQPIHLVDAYTSKIRATYRPFNALDEMESPTVVTFDPSGQRIFAAGFRSDRFIHMFDVATPGRDSAMLRLGKTRRSSDGQKGLVSALTFSPHQHSNNHVFAVGTYAPGSIYLYDDRMPSAVQPAGTILNGVCVCGHGRSHTKKKRRFISMSDNDEDGEDSFSFSAAKVKWFQSRARGGVTQLSFSPSEEFILYSGSRRADSILSWDVRMASGNPEYVSCPVRGLKAFPTDSDTNQRLEFDFDETGNRLFVGGHDNCVRIYNVQSGKMIGIIDEMQDVVNGVSYSYSTRHNCGLLAVAVGSRRFMSDCDDNRDDEPTAVQAVNDSLSVPPGWLELYRV